MTKTYQSQEKRRELREACEKAASYVKLLKDASFEDGGATLLDMSAEGMRLHLPTPLATGDLIELTLPHARNGQFTTVLEACWSKSQNGPNRRTQYLVGCRILYACFD